MNLLKLDFQKYNEDIISAIIEVYGKEYELIIKNRFNNIIFTPYTNIEGIKSYYEFLINCKTKELCIEFLSNIGIDTTKYKIENYIDPLPEELATLCTKYLGNIYGLKNYYINLPIGFKSLLKKYNYKYQKEELIDNQISFINFIKRNNQITKENYKEYKKTNEYKKIIKLAHKIDKVYQQMIEKIKIYQTSIKEYEEYYINEENRLYKLHKRKLEKLYYELEPALKKEIINILNKEKTVTNKVNKLLVSPLNEILKEKTFIEYFSENDELKLKNPSVSDSEKEQIYLYRKLYLKEMGININILSDYDKIIKRDDVKKIIPSQSLVSEITKLKERYLIDTNDTFILESDIYKKTLSKFSNTKLNRTILFTIIKNNEVCLSLGNDLINGPTRYIFLTLREKENGMFDHIIIHEIIHAIESSLSKDNKHRCGFEKNINSSEFSPYHHKRKYERFNEMITDIISFEVRNILLNKKIYITEPKERTELNNIHHNTSKIIKELLQPFVNKYRNSILKTRINGNIDEFKEYIGPNNYEELNDTIDYIDYLFEQGLSQKLEEKNLNDKLVIEYNIQLERLKIIYEDIDRHTNIDIIKEEISSNVKKRNLKRQ